MAVRENRVIALLLAVYLALFILCEYAISRPAKAQESTDTNQGADSSEQAVSDTSGPSIESTDRPQSEQDGEQSEQLAPRPDPVFQEQTVPPPHRTLGEKKSPLLVRRENEQAAKNSETSQPPPPKRVEERRPPAPDVRYIWVPGFWYWYNAQYVWIPGRWIAPRPGFVFMRPRWTWRAGVWVFLPGGWAIAGSTSIVHPLDIGIFIRPWLRHHRYHRHRGHFRGFHRHGRGFHSPRGRRTRVRIKTRRATQPRSRARSR